MPKKTLTFLVDTNLGLSVDDPPVREVLASADIEVEQSTDLVAIDESIYRHEPDFAFMPSADFLQMLIGGDHAYRGLAIASSKVTGMPRMPTVLVVRTDDPATSIDDLGGAKFGYINRSCSSSYFSPAILLARRGKSRDEVLDLVTVEPGPTWQGLVDAVIDGKVRATMVPEDTWRATSANAETTKIIDRHTEGVGGIVVVREDVDEATRALVLDALLRWMPPWDGKVYGAFKPYVYADVHAFLHDLKGLLAQV